jgi:hypothetical protein
MVSYMEYDTVTYVPRTLTISADPDHAGRFVIAYDANDEFPAERVTAVDYNSAVLAVEHCRPRWSRNGCHGFVADAITQILWDVLHADASGVAACTLTADAREVRAADDGWYDEETGRYMTPACGVYNRSDER